MNIVKSLYYISLKYYKLYTIHNIWSFRATSEANLSHSSRTDLEISRAYTLPMKFFLYKYEDLIFFLVYVYIVFFQKF